MLWFDSGAGVSNAENDTILGLRRLDRDLAALGRVPESVLHQVQQDLLERDPIGVDYARCRRDPGFQGNALRVGDGRHTRKYLRDCVGDRHGLGPWLPMTRFDSRKVEQLIDDALHASGIAVNSLSELGSSFRGNVRILKRLRESADDSERSAELVRDVRDKIPSHGLELSDRRQIEEGDHRTALNQWARREGHCVAANHYLLRLGLGSVQRERYRAPERDFTREVVDAEWKGAFDGEQAAPDFVYSHDFVRRGDRDYSFIERFDERGENRLLRRECRDAGLELLREAINGIAKISNLAGRGERGVAPPLSGGDRARDISEFDNRLGDGPGEKHGEDCREKKRNQTSRNNAVPGGPEYLLDGAGRNGDAGDAVGRFHGDVKLLLAGRWAHAARRPDAVLESGDYFWTSAVIFETLKRGPVKIRITDDATSRVNQGNAVPRRHSGLVGEGIRIQSRLPLRSQQLGFAGKITDRPISDARMKLIVDDDHDRHHHHRNYRQ